MAWSLAGLALALTLFAAALFTFVVALLALALQTGFLVRSRDGVEAGADDRAGGLGLSLIHISEPTRQEAISYAVFCVNLISPYSGRFLSSLIATSATMR